MVNQANSRFIEKLEEQMRFIARSCDLFDQGHEDEALRLATHLRTIFHDSKRSVSLLTHLNLKQTTMLSSSRGYGNWQDYLTHEINFSTSPPLRMRPLLSNQFVEKSLEDWWTNEPVFIHKTQEFSRNLIIRSAADKDGGAHVDAQLEAYYQALCAGEYAIGIIGNLQFAGSPAFQQGVTIYPKNAHLALIRQFAHEMQSSAEYFDWLKKCISPS